MHKILVAGSIAYDHLYTFPGVFERKILGGGAGPISIAFNVKDKAIHYGGCAGNIAYNGKLLHEDFAAIGIAGKDFGEYEKWLKKNGISTKYIIRDRNTFTSQASVVTDKKGQQITLFHEGAAARAGKREKEIRSSFRSLARTAKLAMISPNPRDFMLTAIESCRKLHIPYFFDPGQAMPVFSASEFIEIIKKSAGIIFNEYESHMAAQLAKIPFSELRKLCPLTVVTLGERGSKIYFQSEEIAIPAIRAKSVRDPTGCGDAYRAGLLAGIQNEFPKLTAKTLKKAGMLGSRLAAACLGTVGTQNHKFSFQ